jgi:hypothetical protein
MNDPNNLAGFRTRMNALRRRDGAKADAKKCEEAARFQDVFNVLLRVIVPSRFFFTLQQRVVARGYSGSARRGKITSCIKD